MTGLTQVTAVFLLVACLPALLAHPTNEEYEIIHESPYGNSLETDSSKIFYDIVPLNNKLNREKRQISVVNTAHSDEVPDKSVLNKQGVTGKKPIDGGAKPPPQVWLNVTRKPSDGSDQKPLEPLVPGSSGGNRLRAVADNQFVNNNATVDASNSSETKGTLVPTNEDSFYPQLYPDQSFDEAKDNDTVTFNGYNNSVVQRDVFKYYNVSYFPEGSTYWVNMNGSAVVHNVLSDAHRRAATITPQFEFPFYGHHITNVTVATGGFIYLGEQVHAWLAATQYVAPLMANFESSASDEDRVSYLSTPELFSVEWKKLRLQDNPHLGNFTFQTTLYKNGTIVFGYESIPVPIKQINDTNHPVKVGLSDAYIKDRGSFVIKQKTIYEYDRVDLKEQYLFDIANGSAVVFTPADTCQKHTDCESCVTVESNFDCAWCPKLNRCSDGWDRKRQDWVQSQCDKDHVQANDKAECAASAVSYNINSTPATTHDGQQDESGHPDPDQDHYSSPSSNVKREKAHNEGGTGAGGVLAIMFFVIAIFASVGWLVYAYMYPHTPSGQMLIRYRPSQWAFRRGEARYTAASIHM